MNKLFRDTRIQVALLLLVASVLIYGAWLCFHFKRTLPAVSKLGYIELTSSSGQKLYPRSSQPARLKGEYQLQNVR